MFNQIKNWLQDQTPIPKPTIGEIKIIGGIAEFGKKNPVPINFPLINHPKLTEDYSLTEPLISDGYLSFLQKPDNYENQFENLHIPETVEKPFQSLDVYPKTIDLLKFILPPGCTGKNYQKEENGELEKRKTDPRELDRTICKHGSPRYACAICDEEEKRRRVKTTKSKRQVKLIDVFELLLPFLIPPFEHMLDQPLLFPSNLRPRDYQTEGIRFLIDQKTALLGDDMGLGKTIQTIIAIRILVRKIAVKKILIVCPLSLLGNWEKEINKWAPELYVRKIRGSKEFRNLLWKSPSVIYLTTYETVRDDMKRHVVSGAAFDLVVLDEIQRIKNPNSAISQSIRKFGPKYRWGLSGTPLENKLDDVIAIFRFLGPTVFDNRKDYYPEQVKIAIEPYFLRRRIEDVVKELPEKKVNETWLDLNEAQRFAYDKLYAEARSNLSSSKETSRIHIFALLNKLKQICNIEPDTGDSCKVDYLKSHLSEIVESGYKALIFSQFPKKTLNEIKDSLVEFDPVIFDGSLSSKQREKIIDDFQEKDSPKILLASIKAAGVGLNLTRANYVFHFDHWWNPAIANQAEARAYRIGQSNTVFVHDIYTNDTVEERIHKILMEKQYLFDTVIDNLASEYVETTISDEDLYRIFELEMPGAKTKSNSINETKNLTNYSKLKNLNPKGFENLVAYCYQKMGFNVKVSGGAFDQGVDVVARRVSDIGMEHLIIQCKHYPNRPISPNIVREMIGTKLNQTEATRAVLVTSGTFSEEAKKLAAKHNIVIIDGNHLMMLIRKYGVEI